MRLRKKKLTESIVATQTNVSSFTPNNNEIKWPVKLDSTKIILDVSAPSERAVVFLNILPMQEDGLQRLLQFNRNRYSLFREDRHFVKVPLSWT
jgi:hypothetical protein